MFKTFMLQYGLKAIGKGAAIIAGALATKYGVDGETAAAIQAGIVAGGGVVLNEGVDWFQKWKAQKKTNVNSAKVAIIASETKTNVSPAKVAQEQTAYDKQVARQGER